MKVNKKDDSKKSETEQLKTVTKKNFAPFAGTTAGALALTGFGAYKHSHSGGRIYFSK
jgi:hypothetical protein